VISSIFNVLYTIDLREEEQLKDSGVDGRVLLKWVLQKWYGGMDWIDLA
jgi:hypothetical protein